MNKKYTLISISILTALYSQQSLADLHAQCLLGVPHFTGEVVKVMSITYRFILKQIKQRLISQLRRFIKAMWI